MARAPKNANNIQVFRGSRPKADVFTSNASVGCCGTVDFDYDKLGDRVRFDNGLKHVNPTGGVDRYRFPSGNGFADDRAAILAHINAVGVGAEISLLAIPTFAFLTGWGIHVESEEEGLTFDVRTRNGLVLPSATAILVTTEADPDSACGVSRNEDAAPALTEDGEDGPLILEGIGAMLAGTVALDYFYAAAPGSFSLEADEIILRVATMPVSGKVNGTFDLTVSASYNVIHRAER